jgi:hypothetical protein
MRQRYTIDLERMAYQTATVEVIARDLVEAQDMAREAGRKHDFPWVTENRESRVTRVICHAGEVTDEPVDWSQQDASNEVIRAWMKEQAAHVADAPALARAAHEHFFRPYHIDVLRKMAAEIKP